MLANQTAVTALGDGGSSEEIGNGLTNLQYNCTQPFSLLVGGSSLSSLGAAQADPPSVNSIVAPALAGDMATLWQLVVGGLDILPANMTSGQFQFFVETPWNYYNVAGTEISGTTNFHGGYMKNTTTNGGVDPTQPVPSYQVAYGLNPTTSDPLAQVGRGAPDVTANAGGNASYRLANANMSFTEGFYYGTSAASPLWASLIAQIDTIFDDQGLPDLGYAHDLLYTASAIAPASFNDLTMGNNISSFVFGGSYTTESYSGDHGGRSRRPASATMPGRATISSRGWARPTAAVLARTLSAAAHSQMYFADQPDAIVGSLADGWTSGTAQSLLFQTMAGSSVAVDVTIGSGGFDYTSNASATYAWTSQLAMQSLQADFDPALVRLFDKQGQGAEVQRYVAAGQALDVSIDGVDAQAIQAGLTSSVRLRRLHVERRRRARGAAGGDCGDTRAAPTTSRPWCACARTARICCRSLSTRSTTMPAPSTACSRGRRAMPPRRRPMPTNSREARRHCRGRATATTRRRCCRMSMPATSWR